MPPKRPKSTKPKGKGAPEDAGPPMLYLFGTQPKGGFKVIGGEVEHDSDLSTPPNCILFRGECLPDGVITGPGHQVLADGTEYKGSFVSGRLQGKGSLKLPLRRPLGEELITVPDSNSRLSRPNLPSSLTKAMAPSSDKLNITINGFFDSGHVSGAGILTHEDGSVLAEGEWYESKLDGTAVTVLEPGQQDQNQSQNRLENFFVGHYSSGQRDGFGVCVQSQPGQLHDRYEGYWASGLRQGIGRREWYPGTDPAKSTTYIGEWLQGKRHGKGYARFPSGAVWFGRWDQGRAVERLSLDRSFLNNIERNIADQRDALRQLVSAGASVQTHSEGDARTSHGQMSSLEQEQTSPRDQTRGSLETVAESAAEQQSSDDNPHKNVSKSDQIGQGPGTDSKTNHDAFKIAFPSLGDRAVACLS